MAQENPIPCGLEPPIQNAPGVFASTPDGCSPFYRFVTIRKCDDQIEVWEALPKLETTKFEGETYTENVIQTYAIQVPYTTQVDGQTITRFRTEHRTRTVPIQKRRVVSGDAEEAQVEHSYTVSVPYSELIDGVPVTRSRLETRTRMVSSDEIPLQLVPSYQSISYRREYVTLYNVEGEKLDLDDALGKLDQCLPVIQLADPDHIVPFFKMILKPSTLLMVVTA